MSVKKTEGLVNTSLKIEFGLALIYMRIDYSFLHDNVLN